jgi:hypothetical protein
LRFWTEPAFWRPPSLWSFQVRLWFTVTGYSYRVVSG